jgi:guanosine-3',5'-bis(diphosphate) 3'-pyrophosphohydrolase
MSHLKPSWLDAWRFAAEAHNTQKMPDADLPYLHHLGRVAFVVLEADQSEAIPDIDLAVICAILHDCIEDQNVAPSDLAARFGASVADGVLALSKNKNIPKSEAMTDSLARIKKQPHSVWCVKLADRISNLQITPAHWSSEKCLAYRAEARQILDALGSANQRLASWLSASIESHGSAAHPLISPDAAR